MIMLLGDTHGNTKFVVNEVIPAAQAKNVRWIYQVGDFGYWEHTYAGTEYLNDVSVALAEAGISLVFIQGNHDKISMISEKYIGMDGFFKIRPNLWFVENGTVWSPDGGKTNFMALGGAYSIDKPWRLSRENELTITDPYGVHHQTLWFPEEEMSDEQMDVYLNNVTERVDVILAHDKPMASNPPMHLEKIDACLPNQQRLQRAVNTLKPKLFVHGHLHFRYTDQIRSGDDTFTVVEGLGADVNANAHSAWEFLSI